MSLRNSSEVNGLLLFGFVCFNSVTLFASLVSIKPSLIAWLRAARIALTIKLAVDAVRVLATLSRALTMSLWLRWRRSSLALFPRWPMNRLIKGVYREAVDSLLSICFRLSQLWKYSSIEDSSKLSLFALAYRSPMIFLANFSVSFPSFPASSALVISAKIFWASRLLVVRVLRVVLVPSGLQTIACQ